MFQCEMRGCGYIWLRLCLESHEQLGSGGIWAVFGEWVKLGLVCILVSQIRFRLCLSDRLG